MTSENILTFDSPIHSYLHRRKTVGFTGLEDFIVVDTKDVLLICKKDKEQQVKEFLSEVKKKKGDKYI
jgi:mannose-1-phosphate guanylyltransferase